MPITFDCACGKVLRAADEHAGRRVKCPACGVIGVLPTPEPMFEVVEDSLSPQPAKKSRPDRDADDDRPTRSAKKAVAADEDDDHDTRGSRAARTRQRDDDDDDDDEKPRAKKKPKFREGSGRDDEDDDDEPRWKKKKKRRSSSRPPQRQDNSGRSLESRILNGGVAGGMLAMVIAVVWCIAGLCFDRFFLYTPVLFIVGFIAFIKGLTGQE